MRYETDYRLEDFILQTRPEDVPAMALKAQDEAKSTGYPRPLTDEQVAEIFARFAWER